METLKQPCSILGISKLLSDLSDTIDEEETRIIDLYATDVLYMNKILKKNRQRRIKDFIDEMVV